MPVSHRLIWAVLTLVVVGIVAAAVYKRVSTPPPPPVLGTIGQFELTDQNGQVRTYKDFAGRPWIAAFIFTRCGGTCPTIVRSMTVLKDRLDEFPELQLVCLSMDPEFDTPDVLKRYAVQQNAEHPRWLFLTGKRDEILRVTQKDFKLGVEAGVSAEEPILHSPKLVLVDGEGMVRGYFDGIVPDGMDELTKTLRALKPGRRSPLR